MHGWENMHEFDSGLIKGEEKTGVLGFDDREDTVGANAAIIYESIRDGKMQGVVAELLIKTGKL